ncbi:MAG: GTP-binding protein [Candidatus Heimdallarchaeota archaeon]|nr:GTP-binding protein [Candidatus Heimdallarchaeota archaeon]
MNESARSIFYKVVLIGTSAVGKTSLRLRYLGQGFREEYLATLGADFAIKKFKNRQIQIWDLSGQINFRLIIKGYFNGAHGIVLVFDVTRRETMLNLSNWIDEFLEINEKLVPTIILANKVDLRGGDIETIGHDEVTDYIMGLSKKYNHDFQYDETSALSGQNIDRAFEKLIDEISKLSSK